MGELSHSIVSNSLRPYGLQARLLCAWGFFRQEYWSGLLCPPPGDLLNPEIKPTSLMSPALADRFFTTSSTREALCGLYFLFSQNLKIILKEGGS